MITTMPSDQNGPPPRVEVITSVQRRRRWPTAEKIRLVEETMQPGMSVSYVARRAADKMDSSHKAILTIQKIHRVMCVRVQQPARAAAEGGGTVGMPLLLQPTGPFMNR